VIEAAAPEKLDEAKRRQMLSAVRAAVNKSREILESRNE
jgi:hypothetical protein